VTRISFFHNHSLQRDYKKIVNCKKFGTLVDWMNTCGVFFIFFENLPFWAFRTPKTSGQPKEVKNGPIMFKFGTIVD